jgi:hypothetical protein
MLQYDPFINVKASRTEFFHKNQGIGNVGVRRNKKRRLGRWKGRGWVLPEPRVLGLRPNWFWFLGELG